MSTSNDDKIKSKDPKGESKRIDKSKEQIVVLNTATNTTSNNVSTKAQSNDTSNVAREKDASKSIESKDVKNKPTGETSTMTTDGKKEDKNTDKTTQKASVIITKPELILSKPPQVKVAETPKGVVPPLQEVKVEKPKEKSPPKSTVIPIKLEKQIKLVKPTLIITRIFGVTSSTTFGDDMFKYFISKFQTYLSDHWTDPLIQEIVNGLRDQVKKEGISELPQIAASSESKEVIIESISRFITTRSEINKTKPKAKASRVIFPDYMKLKSIVIRGGLHNKDIIAHVYDDVLGAFQVWTTEGKIKIHTLSSGPVDGQLDYFSNTSKGDLSKYITNGISTTNPQINSTETGYVNFRELSKKILQTEPNNILLLTDKVKDAQQAQKTDMNVILISRDGKLGHKSLSEDKEVLADFTIVTGFTSIIFKNE